MDEYTFNKQHNSVDSRPCGFATVKWPQRLTACEKCKITKNNMEEVSLWYEESAFQDDWCTTKSYYEQHTGVAYRQHEFASEYKDVLLVKLSFAKHDIEGFILSMN